MTAATGTVLMTGATRGLGREAAEQLLRNRPDRHVVITARHGQGPALAAQLTARTGNPNVSTLPCDLASLDDVRAAADVVGARLDAGELPPLRGLVGNAGVQLASATRTTADGFEMTFGVNVLAHHLLLRLLLTRFTAPARIFLTTSASHFGDFAHNYGLVPGPRWQDLDQLAAPRTGPDADTRTAGYTTYATSKLAVIHLVHALARRLPPGVEVYSYNPGFVPGTGIIRDTDPLSRFVFRAVMPILQLNPRVAMSPRTSGATLAAAFDAALPGPSGAYIDRGTIRPSSPASYDQDREEALWHAAARWCRLPPA